MKEEKLYTEGISIKKGRFLAWADNFWYHYKWPSIVAAFLIIVFIVCMAQTCSKGSVDVTVTYAGPVSLTAEQKHNIKDALSKNLANSTSDDKSAVNALSYLIMSKEQILEAEKGVNPDGSKVYIDRAFIADEQSTFDSLLMTDTTSVLFLDESIYASLGGYASSERLMPLTDVLGEMPEGAVGNFGVRLGDTEIYQTSPALQVLPEDTIICLLNKRLWQKDYEKEIEAFKSFTKASDNKKMENETN